MYFRSITAVAIVLIIATAAFSQQEIRGGILNGKSISMPKPSYPEELKIAGIGGRVEIEILVDESGSVISATPIYRAKTSDDTSPGAPSFEPPHPLLVSNAQDAAMKARFAPTTLDGAPVKVKGVLVYNFVAKQGDSDSPSPGKISGGILNGKATSLPAPEYPASAKAVKAVGTVNVQVLIDEEGRVVSATAVSGHPLLRSASAKAARLAVFAPTTLLGEPVKIQGIIVYNFVLPDESDQ